MRVKVPLVPAWMAIVLAFAGGEAAVRLPAFASAFAGPFKVRPDFAGYWFNNAFSVVWTAVFWLAAYRCGSSVVRWIGGARRTRDFGGIYAVLFAGFGLYACAIVGMGLVGLFFVPIARITVALLAAGGLAALLRPGWRTSDGPMGGVGGMLRGAALGLGLILGLFSLTPETWSDSLGYHLTAPADFNKFHKWVDIHQDMYRYPLLAEGLFGQGLLVDDEQTATLINLSGGVILAMLVKSFAAGLAGPAAGWLAVLALLASEQVGFHMGQTNQGFFSVGFVFLGVWIWSLGVARSGHSRALSVLAGAVLGWGLCSKLTAAAPLLGITAWHLAGAVRGRKRDLAGMAWLAAGCAMASAPFLLNGWLFTGNPVYPFVWGGLHWGEANSRVLYQYGCPGVDLHLGDAVSMMGAFWRLLSVQLPVVLLALPFLAALRFPGWGAFVAAWTGAILAWTYFIPCLRFMMPIYPALAGLAAAGFVRWIDRAGRWRHAGWAAMALVVAIGVVNAVCGADDSKASFKAAIGLEPPGAYYTRVLTTYWHATRAVNRLVPAGARIVAAGERRGYLFNPLVYNRDIEDTPAMLGITRDSPSPERERIKFRQMGVRYILLNYVTSEYMAAWRTGIFTWKTDELGRHAEFCRRYLEIEWMEPRPDGINGGYVLYRIRAVRGANSGILPFLPGAEYAFVREPGETDGAYHLRLKEMKAHVPGVVFLDARYAASLLRVGHPGEALDLVNANLGADYPEKPVLWGLKSVALHRIGRQREAMEAIERALDLHPGEPTLLGIRSEIGGDAR